VVTAGEPVIDSLNRNCGKVSLQGLDSGALPSAKVSRDFLGLSDGKPDLDLGMFLKGKRLKRT
jgi:hypothetical protein